MLLHRNKEWLASDISLREKLAFYPAIGASYVRLFAAHDKHVRYFGQRFYYDNPATPLNMQIYPYEITHKILRHMKKLPKYALDIGGNIGQFPLTLSAIVPDVKVDALEPNRDIFKILERNVAPYKNVRIHNAGVGKPSKTAKMFYEPSRSGVGSLMKENAGNTQNLKELPITLVDDVSKVFGRKDYDLITIDVEGYEKEVVANLKGVTCRYMFMEVSGQGRSKTYNHAGLFATIQKNFGDFDLVYCSGHSYTKATFDMLIEFKR